jgi:DegV family protein with EDD domain
MTMADDLCISVDSTTTISHEQAEKYGIISSALTYMVDGEEHLDAFSDDLEKSNFYEKLRDGADAAHQNISPRHFMDSWKPKLEAGKKILHLSISSKVSQAYRSACVAADAMNAVYPDSVTVFDTLIGGGCVTVMAVESAEMSLKGASLDQIVLRLMQERDKFNMLLCVDDILHAKKEGIINSFQAAVGTAIGIRPILYASPEGRIELASVTRGLKNVFGMAADIIEAAMTEETTWASVEHAGDEYNALMMVETIRDRLKQVKQTEVSVLSPVLGINGGPGLVAIYFKGKSRSFVRDYIHKAKKK